MRSANVSAWLRREWFPSIQYALALAGAGAALWTAYTPAWVLSGVLLATATGTIMQDRQQRKRAEIDAERQERRYQETQEHRKASEQRWALIHHEVTERADRISRERDSIKAASSMLRRLVDDGVIDMHSFLRRFDTRAALLIYVYAAAVGYKEKTPPRLYPAVLEGELGCVRLPPAQSSAAYLTTLSRLPEDLREPEQLRGYIEHRFAQLFKEEWQTFRAALEAGTAQPKYYVDGTTDDWRGQLRATIIVTELALGPSNLIRLNGGMPTNQVFEIIAEAVDLRRVTLSAKKRRKVKDFMLRQTFDLILENEDKAVRDAMVSARPALDRELACKTIFDYLAVKSDKLAQAIRHHTETTNADQLAAAIHTQLRGYENALLDLGVTGLRE